MSIPSVAARARYSARSTHTVGRAAVSCAAKRGRKLCLVYGNCQAEPVRALLAGSRAFAGTYHAVRIPAVHEIGPSHLSSVQRLIRRASVIVAQPIKDGYRGLPLGTDELVALAPADCTVIRFPILHYDALYPLQFNLLGKDRLAIAAPVTVYHDLRTLCAVAKGLSTDAALRWVTQYRPSESALRDVARQAATLMRDRERTTDISIIDRITVPATARGPVFFTVNHPALSVLRGIAGGVRKILGLEVPVVSLASREPLGSYQAPLEQPVIDALGLTSEATADWTVKGKVVSSVSVVRRQVDWYRRRPDVVRAGIREQAERIATFELL